MKSRRTYEIVEYVKKKKYCSLQELMEHFDVSVATVYRDIAELVGRHQLRKVHGGVASIESGREDLTPTRTYYRDRLVSNREVKNIIAEKALREIADGDTIFLDSSTTVYYLSKLICNSNLSALTIITNSLLIIQDFPLFPPEYTLIALGGKYDLQLNAFLGQDTFGQLERYPIGKFFFSALGVSPAGVFSRHEYHAAFLRQVLRSSRRRFLLADSDKFDRPGTEKIAALHEVDKLISDGDVPGYFSGRVG